MNYFYLVIAIFISNFSFADAWPEMTKSEAEAVIAELKKNPYIFDYCDCCDHDGEYAASVYLMKVTKAEIKACEMDENCFYVNIQSEPIAKVLYEENGPNVSQLSVEDYMITQDNILMNYTWTLNPSTKKATPFFNVISYNYYDFEKTSCKEEFAYPTPNQLKIVSKDKGYKKWYKKMM
jgi:hypothetical protein